MVDIAEKIEQSEFVWRGKNSKVPISLMRPEEKVGAIASCLSRCERYFKETSNIDKEVEKLQSQIESNKDKIKSLKKKKAEKDGSLETLMDIAGIMQTSLKEKDGIEISSDMNVDELNKKKEEIVNSYLD